MRYPAILAIAAAGFVSAAQAEDCTLKQMASLDMTMLPDGRVAVPVTINGTSHRFMVDTAGIFSQISADASQKLGLKEQPIEGEMYGVGGRLHLTAANVKSFMVGNNEARDFHLGVRHAGPGSDSKKSDSDDSVDGLLAPDFLSLFDIELDFAAKKMNLFSQDHCAGKVVYWTRSGYAELPFHYTNGAIAVTPHIELRMALDGHDLATDLDTGASYTFFGRKTAVRIFGIDETSPGVTRVPGSSDKFPIYTKQFGTLALGGLTVNNPQVEILPDGADDSFRMQHSEKSRDDPIYGTYLLGADFTLGMNVLSKLHLYIAYKEHKIYLTAAGAK
ncbi:MAG TPA: retropepsin-like aspartic protease [Rhizomicrobium sp.]|nr:retropepsin-like aspartic protease [Rhizomicrobium sp.]